MPVEPVPCAPDGGGGTPVELTACCAPSIASTALCRTDGTTVLLVVRSGCAECGETAPDPEVVGWIDAATGTFAPGPAPADAGPCSSGCIDTVCVTRCDDTDGDGAPDVTYVELWCVRVDGTTGLVLTYSGDPSTPYAPVAPVECEYGCPHTETLTLCDDTGAFLRRITWLAGTATYEDVDLDGQTPHVVTGDVAVCAGTADSPCAEPTTPTAALGLCLPDGTPLAVLITRDCDGTTAQDGWLNLTTGTYTAGPPPAGAAACGDSRAFELAGLLCDTDPATGDVYGLVLVEYAYNPDGSLASVRLVDPATGATYTLQGELRRCPGDAGVEQPEQDLAILCDTAADGTSTAFVRDYRRDSAGQITGYTDYALDGTPYTPTGTVGICAPEAESCRDSSTVLLCDLPQGGEPDATTTDTDPTPFYPYATGVPVPGGGQALWDGGTLTIPAAGAPQPGTFGTVATLAATVQAPRPGCDDGTAHVAVSVNVAQDGPDGGCAQTGHLRLFNGPAEADQIAVTAPPANTPAGWTGTLTVEADVPAADLAAGTIAVALALDTYDGSSTCTNVPRETAWTLSGFTADVVYAQTGCEAQFLRTLVTDCATGAVLSTTDTTLDGQPYTPTGQVGQCTAAGGGCCPPEPCRDTSTLLLCDADGGTRTVSPQVTDGQISDTVLAGNAAFPLLPKPWTPLWGGGQLVFPPDPDASAGDGSQVYRTIVGQVTGTVPEDCATASGTLTISVRVTNDGPNPGAGGSGWLRAYRNGNSLASDGVQHSTPVGHVETLSVTVPVTAEELAADATVFSLSLETFHGDGPKGWTADQFTVSAELAGCAVQFMRTVTVDCETGAVVAVTDTTLSGEPYTVTGEVGQCTAAGGSSVPEPCRNTATLLLCDAGERPQETSRLEADQFTAGSGTLPNGVSWTAAPAAATFTGTSSQTITFGEPVSLRFAVTGLNGGAAPGTPPTECVQLPEGTIVESLYSNHTWDPGTRTVCNVEVCSTTSTPSACQLGESVFLLTGVTSLRADGTDGGTYQRGLAWIDVTAGDPPVQFLRTLVTDCTTGETTSVTDTTLAGEPYTATGDVSQCQTTGSGGCCPLPEQADLVDCEDGGRAMLVKLCGSEESPGEPLADAEPVELCDVQSDGTVMWFLRHIVYGPAGTPVDYADTDLELAPYTVTGTVGGCAPEPEACPAQNVLEAPRCDDTDGDGIGDTEYIELMAVDCDGNLTSLGTYTCDLSDPYTPVAPVDADAEDDAGAPPAAGVRARRVQLDPGAGWDAATYPTLQSVTAVAHGGDGTITTLDGASTLHAGEAATWSVQRDEDAALTGPLAITADTGTVTVTWTQGVTL